MKKVTSFIILITLLAVTHTLHAEDHSLYQTQENIELSEGITIQAGTRLYGTETPNGIEIQFENTTKALKLDNLTRVEEGEAPEFTEWRKTSQQTTSATFENDHGAITTKKSTYPITEEQSIILGNTMFHQVNQDESETQNQSTQTSAQSTQSVPTNDDRYFTPTQNKITVYDNRSGSLEPVATLQKGQSYPIDQVMDNWIRVQFANYDGYVYKPGTTTYTNKPTNLNNQNLSSKTPIDITQDTTVYERLSGSGNWHTIQFGSDQAYIYKPATDPASNHESNADDGSNGRTIEMTQDITVYDNSTGELVPYARFFEGTGLNIMRDYGNWWQVNIAGQIGYVWKKGTTIDFQTTDRFYQTKSRTPVYERQNGGLVEVAKLHADETYARIRDYGNWHEIQYANDEAYIYKPATKLALSQNYQNPIQSERSIGTATPTQNTTVYDNTGDGLDPFATLQEGETYPIVGDLGSWYEVNISGRYGYVRAGHVEADMMRATDIVKPHQVYSYNQMQSDIDQLDQQYGSLITVETIGKSVHNRDIPVVKIGTGDIDILINASHHAREWVTTNLVMEQLDQYSQAYARDEALDGYDVRHLLDQVTLHYVPMVNPDGVTLVQQGPDGFDNRDELIDMNDGNTDFSSWKANARAVDLNRQYPADWDDIRNVESEPGPE
ncbi:hypothetical protein ABID56_002348 [Alkalibacillus flavidus]|uniref:Peptidase M14 domain-containing protein n=1 Tax=Alkalibacillus flavidus TaxID=546021 RepID=A0ABV2KXC3_9BACI